MKRLAVAFAALCLGAPALAQAPAKVTSEGRWELQTARYATGCSITGFMTIKRAGKNNVASCSFESVEFCPGSPTVSNRVKQTCTAKITGAKVEIISRIEKVVATTPADRLARVRTTYVPDHFTVSLNADGSEMTGKFYSGVELVVEAFVRFKRKKDLYS